MQPPKICRICHVVSLPRVKPDGRFHCMRCKVCAVHLARGVCALKRVMYMALCVGSRRSASRRTDRERLSSLLPVGLVDDEVTPSDILERSLLQVGHLVRRDQLGARYCQREGRCRGERKTTTQRNDKRAKEVTNTVLCAVEASHVASKT